MMRALILMLACLSGCVTITVEKKSEVVPAQQVPGLLQQAIENSPPAEEVLAQPEVVAEPPPQPEVVVKPATPKVPPEPAPPTLESKDTGDGGGGEVLHLDLTQDRK